MKEKLQERIHFFSTYWVFYGIEMDTVFIFFLNLHSIDGDDMTEEHCAELQVNIRIRIES